MKFFLCCVALAATASILIPHSFGASFRKVGDDESVGVYGGACKKRTSYTCGARSDYPDGYPAGCAEKTKYVILDDAEDGSYSTLNFTQIMCATTETSACGWTYDIKKCVVAVPPGGV